jgi:hypothetical protein
MRKGLVGTFVVVLAALALASGASAAHFEASLNGAADEGLSTKGSAGTAGDITLTLNPEESIVCAALKSDGLVKGGSGFMSDALRFSKCSLHDINQKGPPGPVRFAGPMHLLYESGLGSVGLTAPESIEIVAQKCTISLPTQLMAQAPEEGSQGSGAGAGKVRVYAHPLLVPTNSLHRFPTGQQPKLELTFDHSALGTYAGGCVSKSAAHVLLTGKVVEEVPRGSLSFGDAPAIEEEPVFALPELPAGWVHIGGYIGPEEEREPEEEEEG